MSTVRGTERPRAATPMDKWWQDNGAERASHEPALGIDVAGFEGPLDLLLYLARNQNVDLSRISVL
ncbi:segregation/condensation protein A, partial [Rhizobium ruizarguesonis]